MVCNLAIVCQQGETGGRDTACYVVLRHDMLRSSLLVQL